MKKWFFILLVLPLSLLGQTDSSDSLKLKADLAITGFWQRGNVETVIFRARSEVRYQPFRKWVFKTTNSYVYQEFGRQKADEDILSLNFLYFNPERKTYPLLLGFASTNFRREIDLRYLLGAGVTYQLIDKKEHSLKVALSGEFEQTDFDRARFNLSEYNGERTITTWRSTLWIKGRYQLFDKKLILTHESFYQPSLERGNNYRWQADIGIELPVWKHLNFKVNYLNTFESIVIENQEQEDRFLTFGLVVKSY